MATSAVGGNENVNNSVNRWDVKKGHWGASRLTKLKQAMQRKQRVSKRIAPPVGEEQQRRAGSTVVDQKIR